MSEIDALQERFEKLKTPIAVREPKLRPLQTDRPSLGVVQKENEGLKDQVGRLTTERDQALAAAKRSNESKAKAEKELKERPTVEKVVEKTYSYEYTSWWKIAVGVAIGAAIVYLLTSGIF